MHAVTMDDDVLVAVFLLKQDAILFRENDEEPETLKVEEFDMDWSHWVEARKTLGIY
jgi:hypothetical protein